MLRELQTTLRDRGTARFTPSSEATRSKLLAGVGILAAYERAIRLLTDEEFNEFTSYILFNSTRPVRPNSTCCMKRCSGAISSLQTALGTSGPEYLQPSTSSTMIIVSSTNRPTSRGLRRLRGCRSR